MTRPRAALLLSALFLLGLLCGVLGTAAFTRHWAHHGGFSHDRMEGFVTRRLTRRLDLDDTQQRTLQDVIHKARLRLEAVHQETVPRIEAILDDACAELRPSLDAGQQKKLDTIREEARQHLRRHSEKDAGP